MYLLSFKVESLMPLDITGGYIHIKVLDGAKHVEGMMVVYGRIFLDATQSYLNCLQVPSCVMGRQELARHIP